MSSIQVLTVEAGKMSSFTSLHIILKILMKRGLVFFFFAFGCNISFVTFSSMFVYVFVCIF